jgi:hypothetical protein
MPHHTDPVAIIAGIDVVVVDVFVVLMAVVFPSTRSR